MRALLTRLWLLLGKCLLRLVGAALVLGLLGWGIGSLYYAWKFSGPVANREQIPPDEAQLTQAIIEDAIRIVDQHRDNTRVLRDAHAKAHGCVKAEVRVEADLPVDLRQGVFAQPGKVWNAWVRFSNGNAYPQQDSERDARGMAIKLLDVPGAKLMPGIGHDNEQDFVMFNHPVFFIRDVAEYQQNFAAQARGQRLLAFFPSWNPSTWEIRHMLIAMQTLASAPASPMQASYFGIAPYKLGEGNNIKFRSIPAPDRCPGYQLPALNEKLPNFLRSALYQQLSVDRAPACFALQVQKQDANRYMPIEDPSVAWSEKDSPFQTVALISIPAQDFDSREQNLLCDNLSFNPWHALPEHRPIGGINRLRKAVYEAVSVYRHQRNGVPGD
ncbi:catalase family protein [Pseudomonas panipatensis]|uniref:catalase n=1 Tax=Pseudomonas panipatensis TaxID=428992 RepID=A0A1G8FF30_9PSED|nr:catalase family protein [Pseudomonas panipatensis]SDH80768.1 Catalase [Pseudomonas panipatensis]SMP54046.1 Catalase [Pseudomonas panipatensis]